MTILTLNRKSLEKKIGKITPEIEEKISMFGTPIEEVGENEISVEVFPNRPDLLSQQGFERALYCFLKKPEIKKYKIEKPQKDYRVIIDKSVKKVRPFTACAIIKNLKLDEDKIKEIIDIQEKLHGSYGRNRKKLAIGIYPLEKIKLPIKFTALKPENIKFQPLGFSREINGRQVLSQHPTGREYGDLLKGKEMFPVFIDANNEILSMPPIINSEKTGKITSETKEIFIECSGFEKSYLKKTLNIIVSAFADLGGKIYSMEIIDSKKEISPDLNPEKMRFSVEFINKNLGLSLSKKEIKKFLEKMGIGIEGDYALIPPYRTDIIHQIDLVEEVAIAYGYNNFKEEIPEIATIGEEDKNSIFKKKIQEILIGLNLIEISTFHLSTKEKQFKNLGIKEFRDKIIEVENSKTENNILRTSLLSHSIATLSENTDSEYPQRIFEIGKVFFNDENEIGVGECENLCISISSDKANFTEIKQILDYLMRMLDKEYGIRETKHFSFIDGRCGEIVFNGEPIGILGEISPNVLKNNKLKMPVVSLEMKLEKLIN